MAKDNSVFLLVAGIVVFLVFGGVPLLHSITEASGISHEFVWHGIEFKAVCDKPGPIEDEGSILAMRDSKLVVSDGSIFMGVSGQPFKQGPGGVGCLLQTDNLDLKQYKQVKLSMLGHASSNDKQAGSAVIMYLTNGDTLDVPVKKVFTDRTNRGTAQWGDAVVSVGRSSQPTIVYPCAHGEAPSLNQETGVISKAAPDWAVGGVPNLCGPGIFLKAGDREKVFFVDGQEIPLSYFADRQANLLFEVGAGSNDDKGGGVSASIEITQIEITGNDGSVVTIVSNRTRPTFTQLKTKGIDRGVLDQSRFMYYGDVKLVDKKATFVPVPVDGAIGFTGQGEVVIDAPLLESGMVEPAIYVFEPQGDVGGRRHNCGAGTVMGVDGHTIYDVTNRNIIPTVGSVGLESDAGLKPSFQEQYAAEIASGEVSVPVRGGGPMHRVILAILPDDKVMWSFDDGQTYSPVRKLFVSGGQHRGKNSIVFGAQTNNGNLCPVSFDLVSAKRMTFDQFLTDGLVVGTEVEQLDLGVVQTSEGVSSTGLNMTQNVTVENAVVGVGGGVGVQGQDVDALRLLNETRTKLRPAVASGGGIGTSGLIVLGAILLLILIAVFTDRK